VLRTEASSGEVRAGEGWVSACLLFFESYAAEEETDWLRR
jgi:hypothetical protein